MNLNNTVALVSGANRGLGKALVQSLLEKGASKVYAGARDISKLPNFLDPRVIPIQLDITDIHSVNQALLQTKDVNLLINNAGTLTFGDVLSVSDESLTHNFAVNYFGLLNMAKAFTPIIETNQTLKKEASIVNILTLLSLASMPSMSAYNASKAAAWSAHLSLKGTLADKAINVQAVFPGAIDTDMLAEVDMDKTSPAEVADNIVAGIIANQEDIFPDEMSKGVYKAWCEDHKAVEKQFAQM
ncbi:SDR family oxidoreductase [Marinicellulosiphila megalodicopiae]|uniref:SDR family oxidoreductase n=1 Tax=Marinicellulosiphila megalodicopiae TaxID=2724896 RepID=UPI003BB19A6E